MEQVNSQFCQINFLQLNKLSFKELEISMLFGLKILCRFLWKKRLNGYNNRVEMDGKTFWNGFSELISDKKKFKLSLNWGKRKNSGDDSKKWLKRKKSDLKRTKKKTKISTVITFQLIFDNFSWRKRTKTCFFCFKLKILSFIWTFQNITSVFNNHNESKYYYALQNEDLTSI